ncbi:maleylpyruvate isomerase family mycothiol-dependent enzyme [Kineosporia succinea]|uniref:Uncharacterized protein (TIGR03083 family) n=1 Tax=Kineosporia succinea TaxID=84632 RepID=A0ABT9PB95_9ACTN|nr:maleylpyruvate isomerase family mycothiol-dependent enzyme [Kineosporia succinea]MDP9829972.1 uncharacterized protein (TIGR03083 family) [Kineosporia succinea]
MSADIHALTTANRLLLADLLESLDDEQWRTETLCAGWSAQEMAAHLVQPMVVGFPRFFVTAIRYRGDTDRTVDHITRRLARRPRAELVQQLRRHAGDRLDPPRVGPMGPYVDTCVHLRDLARPLGLQHDVPLHQWRLVLDYLTAPGPARALFGVRSLQGLRLSATDLDWSHGEGDLVEGPAEALALAVTGRAAALADLRGPGRIELR